MSRQGSSAAGLKRVLQIVAILAPQLLSGPRLPPLQVLEARAKGRTAARPAAGLDPALAVARGGPEENHNAAVVSWAEAAEELARVEAHFGSQTMTLQVSSLGCLL